MSLVKASDTELGPVMKDLYCPTKIFLIDILAPRDEAFVCCENHENTDPNFPKNSKITIANESTSDSAHI